MKSFPFLLDNLFKQGETRFQVLSAQFLPEKNLCSFFSVMTGYLTASRSLYYNFPQTCMHRYMTLLVILSTSRTKSKTRKKTKDSFYFYIGLICRCMLLLSVCGKLKLSNGTCFLCRQLKHALLKTANEPQLYKQFSFLQKHVEATAERPKRSSEYRIFRCLCFLSAQQLHQVSNLLSRGRDHLPMLEVVDMDAIADL